MAKILVIEDDREILAVVKLILIEEGHLVEGSIDGTILQNIDLIKPDLIILDDWLGRERGSEFCIKLKSDSLNSLIHVILFTAQTGGEEVAKCANADAFLSKPFDIDELTTLINKLIKIKF